MFKAYHKDACEKLPLGPDHVRLTYVDLGDPNSGGWFPFAPKALLFSAVSAVIHYNCFSRLISVLPNKLLRLPVFSYYDDSGRPVPLVLITKGVRVFERFPTKSGARLGVINSTWASCSISWV